MSLIRGSAHRTRGQTKNLQSQCHASTPDSDLSGRSVTLMVLVSTLEASRVSGMGSLSIETFVRNKIYLVVIYSEGNALSPLLILQDKSQAIFMDSLDLL